MLKKSIINAARFGAVVAAVALVASSISIAEEPKKEEPAAAAAPAAEETPGEAAARKSAEAAKAIADRKVTPITGKPPLDLLKDNPLGTMRNPFTDDATKIEEGKKLYFSYSCNGCHGGGGGGGMCPPLTNDTWVYGSDDDTLYRLIVQGTKDYVTEHSLKRKGQESVVGPMPPFGSLIKTDEEVWKVIAFIRSTYKGSRRNW